MQTISPPREPYMPMTLTPWVNVAAGIAAIITPFGVGATNAFRISYLITGIIIVIVALATLLSSHSRSDTNVAVINIIAGI